MSTTEATKKSADEGRRRSGSRGRPDRLPTRPRLRAQAIGGVLLIFAAACIGGLLFLNVGDRTAVLVAAEPVAAGQTITQDDLASRSVAGVKGAVPVESADQLMGKTAKVGIVEGQIITTDAVTDSPLPDIGQATVGLALTGAQLPAAGLQPGDQVQIYAVAGADTAASGDLSKQGDPLVERAQVLDVTATTSGDASSLVTVVVPQAVAGQVVQYAAAGRVAIAKVAPQGR